MSLAPLNSASGVIQIHAWVAIFSLFLGALVLWRRKGTSSHRWYGRVWLIAMLATAGTSFFIHELRTWGIWSAIHILSLITLVLMIRAYVAIRQRKIKRHADLIKSTYYNALLLATFFTFMPGRIMHEVVFGQTTGPQSEPIFPLWIWIVAGVVLVVGGRAFAQYWWAQRQLQPRGNTQDPNAL